jgi:hypothetical protein
MKLVDTAMRYNVWHDRYGFDLWGEFGEDNEIYPNGWMAAGPVAVEVIGNLLEQGRIVSLVDYEGDCSESCTEDGHAEDCQYVYGDNDFVMQGWALVDVVRRVVLPEGWDTDTRTGA